MAEGRKGREFEIADRRRLLLLQQEFAIRACFFREKIDW